ncbi:PC4/YdbC family ssDNA-binding protein [Erythrobacter sp. sf7]|uniref:PC4/YdbC family ssDNA-binding protein n=1 Tax=Erythrobacter fulvus TaxID=2987523 RepID=A0ABT5JR86_9SPHN|nr:PC4/YdbC family ssDNA-binding protein [Erythrobacter fulvus]MDC8755199.1 PC4/YdbC family ssDNA-binding protein [Erythrobacter fulvus]
MEGSGFTSPPIWQFAKRGGFILAGERSFKGETFFELRWWAEDGTIPTGKGVTFPPDAVPELAKALAAYAESRKAGAV